MRPSIAELKKTASALRGRVIEMSHRARAAHLGSALSCIDIITAAYWSALNITPDRAEDPCRDRFILSKGHAAAALYAALHAKGFISDALLDSFGQEGGCLEEHPAPGCAPGVEAATGSLGHGLSIGIGMALAGRILDCRFRVLALISDGECNEGSVWEAAMFAAGQRLGNVCAVVDFNKWQATDRSCEVMALEPLVDKWKAFGWSTYEIDGHDMNAIVDVLSRFPDGSGKPMAVIAHTVKGKGVSFMEDDNNWHYRIPTEDEVIAAKKELALL